LAYVKLDGDVGVIGNGAGLVMATPDAIQLYSGKPANFLDVGGAHSEKIAAALRIVLLNPDVKAVLVNILGGITRCDEIAKDILQAGEKLGVKSQWLPVWLEQTRKMGGEYWLKRVFTFWTAMEETAKRVVEIAKRVVNGHNCGKETRAIVQGITGAQGNFHTKLMLEYGTKWWPA